MAKDSYWFRHDSTAGRGTRMRKMAFIYGHWGKGIYWDVIEMLRDQSNYCYPSTEMRLTVIGEGDAEEYHAEILSLPSSNLCEINYSYRSFPDGEFKYRAFEDIKEASPSAQQEFVKANPGMQYVEEPKAGDMVEGSNGNGWILTKFTGGKLSSGDFICEDMEYNGQRSLRNSIMFYEKIRLPQKSEVESKAFEFLNGWVKHNSPDEDLKVITDAIKWGQANPDKI